MNRASAAENQQNKKVTVGVCDGCTFCYSLPLISTMITIIIIAEGHKIHTTIDETYHLGNAQVM